MKTASISKSRARQIWLAAQKVDTPTPFGDGPGATVAAVEHLGYVQIDTINVIERCHHHILFTRIPGYQREHLRQAQSVAKSVFEYWTHALSYVPTRDIRYFLPAMKRHQQEPDHWYADASEDELRRLVRRIRKDGPLSIRDIDDDELVEKDHPWVSRKPSKRVLQLGFYNGVLTISERKGMVKTYELMDRHFGWGKRPRPATANQITEYLLERALRTQGIVNVDSIAYLDPKPKPALKALIEAQVRRRRLVPVAVEGAEKVQYWARPEALASTDEPERALTHILSPFDPLIHQRKRTKLFFDYEHLFEAYVPKSKRKLGYFALPVLVGDQIVAAIDLKTDRAAGKMLIQAWHWVGIGNARAHKAAIEDALDRFEAFQLGS